MTPLEIEAIVDLLIQIVVKLGGELILQQKVSAWVLAKQAADVEATAKFGPEPSK